MMGEQAHWMNSLAVSILIKNKAEAQQRRYKLPSKKPPPLFEDIAAEHLQIYRANRSPRSVERHEVVLRPLKPVLGGKRLADINPLLIERYKPVRRERGAAR
jgi:hypothetical protein